MAILDPVDFLNLIRQSPGVPTFRLATIPSTYVSGRPTLTFDGEGAATTRTYPHLAAYTPAANDRVLVAMVGHSGVVLGKVV